MDEQNTSMNPPQDLATARQAGGLGPMIGVAIILGLIIVGGVYFYGLQLQQENQREELPLILGNEPDPVPETMPNSDEVSSIESDVDAADMAQLEAQIEADLKAMEGEL